MSKFFINGGKKLEGQVQTESAKNSLLPILAACNLIDDKVEIKNATPFLDVLSMCEILSYLGGKCTWSGTNLIVDMSGVGGTDLPNTLAGKVRASIFMLGPILARHKKAKIAYPGGCDIGLRPIDLHLSGMRALGAKVVEKNGYIYCDGSNMHGADVILNFPSVGATENIMMAATLTKGRTRIYNCAKEPEIVDLQDFLNACGGRVFNAGCSVIEIEGVPALHGTTFEPIKDRIIAGTYMIACAMCGGKVTILGANRAHNQVLISKLSNSSCQIDAKSDKIIVQASSRAKALGEISTAVYPGFPTDLQAQVTALACLCQGSSMIVENLFEARFKHIPELIKMGGDISFRDRVCVVRGRENLFGADVNAYDLRGGAALILAGLAAQGYTTISGAHFVDRGYFEFEKNLALLGADVKRIED